MTHPVKLCLLLLTPHLRLLTSVFLRLRKSEFIHFGSNWPGSSIDLVYLLYFRVCFCVDHFRFGFTLLTLVLLITETVSLWGTISDSFELTIDNFQFWCKHFNSFFNLNFFPLRVYCIRMLFRLNFNISSLTIKKVLSKLYLLIFCANGYRVPIVLMFVVPDVD